MHDETPQKRGLHRDWRTWAAVVVLLIAAAAYVLNLDRVAVPETTAPKPLSVPGKP